MTIFIHMLFRYSLTKQPIPLNQCDIDGLVCKMPGGFDNVPRIRQQIIAADVIYTLLKQSIRL